jgi:hypothetical protein
MLANLGGVESRCAKLRIMRANTCVLSRAQSYKPLHMGLSRERVGRAPYKPMQASRGWTSHARERVAAASTSRMSCHARCAGRHEQAWAAGEPPRPGLGTQRARRRAADEAARPRAGEEGAWRVRGGRTQAPRARQGRAALGRARRAGTGRNGAVVGAGDAGDAPGVAPTPAAREGEGRGEGGEGDGAYRGTGSSERTRRRRFRTTRTMGREERNVVGEGDEQGTTARLTGGPHAQRRRRLGNRPARAGEGSGRAVGRLGRASAKRPKARGSFRGPGGRRAAGPQAPSRPKTREKRGGGGKEARLGHAQEKRPKREEKGFFLFIFPYSSHNSSLECMIHKLSQSNNENS